MRKELTSSSERELNNLVDSFRQTKNILEAVTKVAEEIRAQILTIVEEYDLPIVEEKSQYFNADCGVALRVTRGEYVPIINPQLLLSSIGIENFYDVCVVEKVQLDQEKWEAAVDAERVVMDDLKAALVQKANPALSLSILKTHKKEEK